jgi:hypothetical protein
MGVDPRPQLYDFNLLFQTQNLIFMTEQTKKEILQTVEAFLSSVDKVGTKVTGWYDDLKGAVAKKIVVTKEEDGFTVKFKYEAKEKEKESV